MEPTLKDVAALAGVSTSAVSRTFTEGASVSDATRRKVEKAAAELGYFPNVLASSLTTRRTKLIGFVSDNLSNLAFSPIFDLFTRGLQERGFRPLLINLANETDAAASVRQLRQYSVDGVIVASSTLPPNFAGAFRDANIPTVHCFGRSAPAPQTHMVTVDNRVCGQMAAHALIDRGYRRLCFLGGPEQATSTRDRLLGFSEIASAAPNVAISETFAHAYSYKAGRAAMTTMIARKDMADAYFCGDDAIAIGAIAALRDVGMSAPEDVGVLGVNDIEMASWSMVGLTTIRQPMCDIIAKSLDLIAALTREPDIVPETTLFDCELIERETLRTHET